jgi:hypothetical protein
VSRSHRHGQTNVTAGPRVVRAHRVRNERTAGRRYWPTCGSAIRGGQNELSAVEETHAAGRCRRGAPSVVETLRKQDGRFRIAKIVN